METISEFMKDVTSFVIQGITIFLFTTLLLGILKYYVGIFFRMLHYIFPNCSWFKSKNEKGDHE